MQLLDTIAADPQYGVSAILADDHYGTVSGSLSPSNGNFRLVLSQTRVGNARFCETVPSRSSY
jgi:hypothetical protein